MASLSDFRKFLPGPEHPTVIGIDRRDAYTHGDLALKGPHLVHDVLMVPALKSLQRPFDGITSDGTRRDGLFPLRDNGAPVEAMTAAARIILSMANAEETAKVRKPIDSEQWRKWSNPEFYIFRDTLRLEEHRKEMRDAILCLLQASMSAKGFQKTVDCMRINHFLGDLVNAPRVLNQYSYNFCLFGEPSLTEPWGWQFYGHHIALHCLVIGRAMVISPTFLGAEPNCIDSGPWKGTTAFEAEEREGLALMQSLTPAQQAAARTYRLLKDPAMPAGRWIITDQRHLGGAFQDNRVIPYEGLRAADMAAPTQSKLVELVGTFIDYLPDGPRADRLAEVEKHLSETYFSWIGAYGDKDAFYYRIQSPVVLVEFDHHSGVFLCNAEPERFHIHTLVRTPNGNDYGKAWLHQCSMHR